MKQITDKRYWDGKSNKSIRYYYYCQRGLALLNEARYLVMAIFAIYFALRIENILFIPLMFVVSIPALIFLGWLYVHRMAKVMEWLNVEFATHFQRHNIDLQEKQLEVFSEMRDTLNEIKKNT